MKLRLAIVTVLIALAILAFVSRTHVAPDAAIRPSESAAPIEPEVASITLDPARTEKPATSERMAAVAETPQVVVKESAVTSATLKVLVVTKETRRPLQQVRVSLSIPGSAAAQSPRDTESSHGTLSTRPTTGADGRVDFDLATGLEFSVSATTGDYSAGWGRADVSALVPSETREIVVELPTEDDFVFFGSVVDRDTREPVPAEIYISPSTDRRGSSTVNTNANGRFETQLASWLHPTLGVRAPGYAPVTVMPDGLHDRSDRAFVITVGRTAKLSVRLSDAHGAPIVGERIHLSAPMFEFVQPQTPSKLSMRGMTNWSAEGKTDSFGVFEFEDLPSDVDLGGEVTHGSQVMLKLQEPIRLKPGESREVVWIVGAGAELHGRVVDSNGAPIARYPVWLIESPRGAVESFLDNFGDKARKTATDEGGEFVYKDVSVGGWSVGPAIKRLASGPADPDLVAPRAVFFQIAADETHHEVEIRADRGLYIRGRVVDPQGAPVEKAKLSAHSMTPNFYATSATGAGGEFAIGPLARAHYKLSGSSWPTYGSSTSVECEAGASDIVIQLIQGGTIVGTVLDGETNQPTEAGVTFSRSGGASGWTGGTQTKPNGKFRFGPLDANTYDIVARDSRQRVGIVRGIAVAAGEEKTGITVTLEPGAHVHLRYSGKAKFAGLLVAAEGTTIANETLEAGVVRDYDVPHGRVTLSMKLDGSDRKIERVFVLAVGETKDLEFGDDWR